MVWALDCQFDSTVDGWAVKIASMIDEHTCESLLHLVERSITAERLVARAGDGIRSQWWPAEGAADGQRAGIDFRSAATVLCEQGGNGLHPAWHAVTGWSPHRDRPVATRHPLPDQQHL
ncbi:hypothetical protein [Nocardia jiangxiensis]|uniref:hypothetical protein n=1 Tax=Nocardia jiangxiensis TaxID=282685 RepID=UPI0012F6CC5D|nr:hypothetical protein [Nocardia jiangxiensis]